MKICKVSLYHIQLPMKFEFVTAKSKLKVRDTAIIKVEDDLGNSGFGEVVAFTESFYTEETLKKAWITLLENYVPKLLKTELKHPFDIHQLIKNSLPMTLAGLENALCDLFFKSRGENTIQAIFNEKLDETIDSGAVLGDMPIQQLLNEAENLVSNGIPRLKIKISPTNQAYKRVFALREKFPNLKIAVDANQSFSIKDWTEIQRLDTLNLACIEEPFSGIFEIPEIKTPICYDESVQNLEDLKRLPKNSVLNVKIGRLGGLYPTKQAIDYCRAHNIGFWIGSMVESGISKILHVQLAALNDNLMAGDLSDSQHYFEEDLIYPEIKFEQGKMKTPTGLGLGVDINEAAIERYAISSQKIVIK